MPTKVATSQPFRALKRFTLEGRTVGVGEVVDLSVLPDHRVRQMETQGFGLRVTAEQPGSGNRKRSPGSGMSPATTPKQR